MTTFQCDWCGYKFNLANKKVPPKKCPYCDKTGGVHEPKMAQDILNETEDKLDLDK